VSLELAVVELSTVRKATYIHVISTNYSDAFLQLNVMRREVGEGRGSEQRGRKGKGGEGKGREVQPSACRSYSEEAGQGCVRR
jgi:hypothetical protein